MGKRLARLPLPAAVGSIAARMKPHRLTILRKGLMVLALPLLYQAVFIGVLLKRQSAHNEAQRLALQAKGVIEQTDHVFRLLVEGQSDLVAFLLTGNPAFETVLTDRNHAITQEMTQLGRLVADDQTQRERFNRVAQRVREQLTFQRVIMSLMHSGERERAIDEVGNLTGLRLMVELGTDIDRFREAQTALNAARLRALDRSGTRQNALLVGGLLSSLGMGAVAAWLFSREVGARLRAVAENTRRITRGETLPAVVPGSDEISELDEKLHVMAEEIAGAQHRERVYVETIERRASELARVNSDLDHKNQEIEMFVYSVSHDLRSPLVNLQGFSQELGLVRDELQTLFASDFAAAARTRAEQLVEKDVALSIKYIQTAVTRLSSIIDALLRLSRAGRVEYNPKMVELAPVVARIVAAMRGSILERGAEMIIRAPLPPVWADATALEQIFANLIGNAVNYLDPKRPGVIEIGSTEMAVEGMKNPRVYFVKDNGLGIAEAWLPKVFAIFQRLHGTVASGEGVGLALVRRVVERHGGRVWVESRESVGSTFFVALPATQETSPLPGIAPRKETISVHLRTA